MEARKLKDYVGRTLTGQQFNDWIIPLVGRCVKVTNADENHMGYQYGDGLNTLIQDFDNQGECRSGGLYFAPAKYAHLWIGTAYYPRRFVRDVTILNDKRVYIESKHKFKSSALYLSPRVHILDCQDIKIRVHYCSIAAGLSDEQIIPLLPHRPHLIGRMQHPTMEQWLSLYPLVTEYRNKLLKLMAVTPDKIFMTIMQHFKLPYTEEDHKYSRYSKQSKKCLMRNTVGKRAIHSFLRLPVFTLSKDME